MRNYSCQLLLKLHQLCKSNCIEVTHDLFFIGSIRIYLMIANIRIVDIIRKLQAVCDFINDMTFSFIQKQLNFNQFLNMSSTSIDKIQKKTKVQGRPSFKNIINIEKQKVTSCDKSKERIRIKSQSKIIIIPNEPKKQKQERTSKIKQVQIEKRIKIEQRPQQKIAYQKENYLEQNIIQQIIKANRKVGKIEDKLNEQHKKAYKLYTISKKVQKQNNKPTNKQNYGQSLRRLQKSKNFLQDYLEQLSKQTQQIQDGYISKLQAFQINQRNKNNLQISTFRSLNQLIELPQMTELQNKLSRLQEMLF